MQKASKLFFKTSKLSSAQSSFIDTTFIASIYGLVRGYAGLACQVVYHSCCSEPHPIIYGSCISYIIYSAKALCIMFSNLN